MTLAAFFAPSDNQGLAFNHLIRLDGGCWQVSLTDEEGRTAVSTGLTPEEARDNTIAKALREEFVGHYRVTLAPDEPKVDLRSVLGNLFGPKPTIKRRL